MLDTKLSAKMVSAQYADIRLVDNEGRDVPYIIQREVHGGGNRRFKEYEVVSKTLEPNKFTRLVIHNPLKTKINNFSLIVRNTTAYKLADLSGSDDQQNWFNISEEYTLSNMFNPEDVSVEKSVEFPKSNYEYYKLEISDSGSAPLNIVKVGNYHSDATQIVLNPVKPISIRQIDSARLKTTYINVTLESNQLLHKLKLSAASPQFYKRNAILYSIEIHKGKTRKDILCTFDVSSTSVNEISIPEIYGRNFVIEIENEDSPPLANIKVTFLQNSSSIVAYLKGGQQYHLDLGNPKAELPHYDLNYFSNNIPKAISLLNVISVERYKESQTENKPSKVWFSNKLWVWGILALVIMLLAFVTYKMILEMGNKEG